MLYFPNHFTQSLVKTTRFTNKNVFFSFYLLPMKDSPTWYNCQLVVLFQASVRLRGLHVFWQRARSSPTAPKMEPLTIKIVTVSTFVNLFKLQCLEVWWGNVYPMYILCITILNITGLCTLLLLSSNTYNILQFMLSHRLAHIYMAQ